jgi:hypothetical protein
MATYTDVSSMRRFLPGRSPIDRRPVVDELAPDCSPLHSYHRVAIGTLGAASIEPSVPDVYRLLSDCKIGCSARSLACYRKCTSSDHWSRAVRFPQTACRQASGEPECWSQGPAFEFSGQYQLEGEHSRG